MKKLILVQIFLCQIFFYGYSLDNYKFDSIYDSKNLNQIKITSLIQDKKGFLWIGTIDGLYRYDGNEFILLQYEHNNKNSLNHNLVKSLVQDKAGDIWVATASGISKLDPNSGECLRYYLGEEEISLSNYVLELFLTRNKVLYASTLNGVFWFSKSNNKFVKVERNPGIIDIPISAFCEDEEGHLIIGTSKGIEFFSISDNKFLEKNTFISSEDQVPVINMLKTSDKNIFIGNDTGVWVFDTETKSIYNFQKKFNREFPVEQGPVYPIFEDKTNSVWFVSEKGLVLFNIKSHEFKFINSEDEIFPVLYDNSGVLWASTPTKGLKKYSKFKNRFNTKDVVSSFINKEKVSVKSFEESEGKFWVGTKLKGLFEIDKQTGDSRNITSNPNNENDFIADDMVLDLFFDEENILWIGTRKGLNYSKIKGEKRNIFLYSLEHNSNTEILSSAINCILKDSKGYLWVGGLNGLICIDQKLKQTKLFGTNSTSQVSLSSNWITSINEGKDGNIWIGTIYGLNKFVKKDGIVIQYLPDVSNPDSLSFPDITDLHVDYSGNLWIGTWSGGINLYNKNNDTFKSFSVKNGLISNTVMGIESDNENIWISTTRGLSKYNKINGEFKNYSSLDGLSILNYTYQASFRTSSKRIYFFGNQSVEIVDESSNDENKFLPPVYITSFKVDGNIVNDNKKIIQNYNKKKYKFSYKEKNFSINFAALDYNIPEKNKYAYRIDPIDRKNEWHYIGNENKITFFNLPDGNNRIYVKGSNSDGIWNEEPTWVDIEIIPPFWRTLWFKFFLITLVSSLIFFLYRLRIKLMIRKMEYDAKLDYFCRKNKISSREKEILKLLIEGKSNKEIEDVLFISFNTVRNHVYNIYQKLGIQKRIQLLKMFEVENPDSGE